MKRVLALITIVLLAASVAGAQSAIGEVTYLEGYPELIRDGDLFYDTLDFGFPLQNFDSIRTDEFSRVELELEPSTGIDAVISVEPDTSFYLNISSLQSEQTGSVELLFGSISVVAREITGRSQLQVRTQSSVAGVRGTTFTVTTAIGGEVLVSTDEGLVEVTDERGFALWAAPGEAVEIDTELNTIRNLKYTNAAVREFRRQWMVDRAEAFRAHAPRILRFYGRRYVVAREQFIQAYQELMSHRDIIDRWIEESRRGITGDLASQLRDKRVLTPPLLRMRASIFVFEHTFARMGRMAAGVRDIAAEVNIQGGETAADLFRRIETERQVMSQRISTVRQVFRLFSERNEGLFPVDMPGGASGAGSSLGSSDFPVGVPGRIPDGVTGVIGNEGLFGANDPRREDR